MSRRPSVAYVLRMFPQTSETFIANEILELERLGVDVRVYSYRRPRSPVRHENVRQIRAPVTYVPDPLYRHPLALFRALRAIRKREPERYRRTVRYVLRHTLRERNPDTWRRFLQAAYLAALLDGSGVEHLHAHFAHGSTRVAMLVSMLTSIPFSFTAHARDIFSRDVDWRLMREKVEQARIAVTVSRFNREHMQRNLGGAADGRIRTIYNGVDLRKFSPDASVEREPDLILGVGRLVEKKGFATLVAACRILRDEGRTFRCEIVGEGELRARLEHEIRDAGLEDAVRLVGGRTQEELPAYYRRAAVVAMPAVPASDGNRDALPTVLLEALACGAPVVASELTGIPEIVDDGENGFLVPPGDARELSRAIALLLESRDLRERFGRAGRRKAERVFDVERNVRKLHRLLVPDAEIEAAREGAVRIPVL